MNYIFHLYMYEFMFLNVFVVVVLIKLIITGILLEKRGFPGRILVILG